MKIIGFCLLLAGLLVGVFVGICFLRDPANKGYGLFLGAGAIFLIVVGAYLLTGKYLEKKEKQQKVSKLEEVEQSSGGKSGAAMWFIFFIVIVAFLTFLLATRKQMFGCGW